MKMHKILFSTLAAAAAVTFVAPTAFASMILYKTEDWTIDSKNSFSSGVTLAILGGTTKVGDTPADAKLPYALNVGGRVYVCNDATLDLTNNKTTKVADKMTDYAVIDIQGGTVLMNNTGTGDGTNFGSSYLNAHIQISNGGVYEVTTAQDGGDARGFSVVTSVKITGYNTTNKTFTGVYQTDFSGTYRYSGTGAAKLSDNTLNQRISVADDSRVKLVFEVTKEDASLNVEKQIGNCYNPTTEADFKETAGAVEKTGSGTLVLSAENLYTGGTIVSAGTLEVANAKALGTGTVSVASGATLKVSASETTFGKVTLAEGAKLVLANGAKVDIALDGKIASGSSVDVAAGSTLNIADGSSDATLSSGANFTVNKAEAIATASVSLPKAGDVAVNTLAAWAFDITKTETDEITVTLQLSSGLDGDAIRVYHKADTATTWDDVTTTVTDKSYDSSTGKLTFKTKSFSSYAAGTTQVIPEPSAFGLLAGIGALALAISRRKRRK